ncbi:hypothetical protein [Novosphingobium sp. B 225]|uniref:hypothetical protein n=1 Tax=Novosphingobium sp. B 225 TaxID=1961849 RepID=UPI000B4B840B|nr:hypothetical protein [Novosphingobium sp. B 225]
MGKPNFSGDLNRDAVLQFNIIDCAPLSRAHDLEHSMSRRGNCHDSAAGFQGAYGSVGEHVGI